MKRSTVLALVLLLAWAGILLVGVGVFFLNQDPGALARLLSERVTSTGVSLSVQQAHLSLFPRPSVKLEGLVARTPNATLFIESCEASPDFWSLTHGSITFSRLRLNRPELFFQPAAAPLSRSLPESRAQADPSPDMNLVPDLSTITLPDWLASLHVSISDGTLVASTAFPLKLSGVTGDIRLPDKDGTDGSLELELARLDMFDNDSPTEATGNAGNPRPVHSFQNIRLSLDELVMPHEDGKASGEIALSFPLPLSDKDKDRVTVRTTLTLDKQEIQLTGQAQTQGMLRLQNQKFPLECRIPFTLSGTLAEWLQQPPAISVTEAKISLGKDAATVQGTLSFARQGKNDSLAPRFEGRTDITHLSLPRWFAFARTLPPGVQTALDALSGSLSFTLSPASLVVLKAEAKTLGTTFRGTGGVSSFAKPVIALRLETENAPVSLIFPEVLGKKASAPAYRNAPLVGLPDADSKADSKQDTTANLGYDIRLSARNATFWKWRGKELAVRIAPAENNPENTAVTIRSNALYGGTAQATLFPNKDLKVVFSANGVDVAPLVTPLAGYTALSGTLSGSGTLTGTPTSPHAFLSGLRSTLDLRFDNGSLTTANQTLPFSRLNLAFQGQGTAAPAATLAYSGKGKLSLVDKQSQRSLELSGTLRLPLAPSLGLQLNDIAASASITSKDGMARASGTLSLDTLAGTLSARGQGQVGLSGAPFSLSGTVQASGLNATPTWDGDISLATSNLHTALNLSLPASRAGSRADVSTHFRMDAKSLHLSNLSGAIGDTSVSGMLSRTKEKDSLPAWTADLGLGQLNLSALLPESKTPSTAPWPTEWLNTFSLDANVRIRELILARVRHSDVSLPVRVSNGVLTADPITASVAGGTAGAGVRLEASTYGLLSRLRYTLNNINVLTLGRERGQTALISGQGNLDADISGTLRSSASIPAALNGSLRFAIRDGDLDATHPGPLSRFSTLSSSGQLSKGVLTTPDLALIGGLTVNGYGSINLNTESLDYQLNVKALGIPSIPVHYYGKLDHPQRSVNATGLFSSTVGSLGNGILNLLDSTVSIPLELLLPR